MWQLANDRSPVIYFFGKQSASPAIEKSSGNPALLAGHDDPNLRKVGWPEFFSAIAEKGLAFAFDPESGQHRFIDARLGPAALEKIANEKPAEGAAAH